MRKTGWKCVASKVEKMLHAVSFHQQVISRKKSLFKFDNFYSHLRYTNLVKKKINSLPFIVYTKKEFGKWMTHGTKMKVVWFHDCSFLFEFPRARADIAIFSRKIPPTTVIHVDIIYHKDRKANFCKTKESMRIILHKEDKELFKFSLKHHRTSPIVTAIMMKL